MEGLKLGTDYLTFVRRGLEGMGDFRKKNILQLTSREKKNLQGKVWEKRSYPNQITHTTRPHGRSPKEMFEYS